MTTEESFRLHFEHLSDGGSELAVQLKLFSKQICKPYAVKDNKILFICSLKIKSCNINHEKDVTLCFQKSLLHIIFAEPFSVLSNLNLTALVSNQNLH